jgi:hypothetical protein
MLLLPRHGNSIHIGGAWRIWGHGTGGRAVAGVLASWILEECGAEWAQKIWFVQFFRHHGMWCG